MKNLLMVSAIFIMAYCLQSCKKDEVKSERFNLLTGHIWVADSLFANGNDESGDTGLLRKFKGETKFNEDGTGYVGQIQGTWKFAMNESAIIISSDSLPIPVTTMIEELIETSLKITTSYPDLLNPQDPMDVRMTFKPK